MSSKKIWKVTSKKIVRKTKIKIRKNKDKKKNNKKIKSKIFPN